MAKRTYRQHRCEGAPKGYITGREIPERICAGCGVRFWPDHGNATCDDCRRPPPVLCAYELCSEPAVVGRRYCSGRCARRASGRSGAWRTRFVRELKEGKPCADCGLEWPFYVLQFDHVPGRGRKLFNLAMPTGRTENEILAEAAKCDIVCANCHFIRTWTRTRQKYIWGLPLRHDVAIPRDPGVIGYPGGPRPVSCRCGPRIPAGGEIPRSAAEG